MANGIARDPLNATKYRTQRSESPEDLWQPIWDRANYPNAGVASINFFAIPRGGAATLIRGVAVAAAGVNKTLLDTNLDNAGVIPTKLFEIHGISWGIIHQVPGGATDLADRDRLRNNGYMRWRIVDKDILILPLLLLPEINPMVVASTTANITTILGTAGGGGIGIPMYRLPIPVTIQPYENFSVEFIFSQVALATAVNSVDLYLIFHSYMRRPT